MLAVLGAVAAAQPRPAAQGLSFALFERYLESLREQAGIPGMSALVLVGGNEAWSAGFGRADVESGLRPTADTPYLIGQLSQSLGATLLLKECIDESYAELNDPVRNWFPGFAGPATIGQVLGHVGSDGSFRYDPERFAALTGVIEACSDNPYPRLLNEEIFTRLSLGFSAPGTAMRAPAPSDFDHFDAADLARFAQIVNRMAKPYHVDRGRHVRTDLAAVRVDAANGIVSSVRDLARFDEALDGVLLERETLARALRPVAPNLPAGLGWFVQAYNREPVVWQFGQVRNAYSALMVKVPNRGLTFILLANSDVLAAPFSGDVWDVTASAFARTFLLMYVP
jgi:CubicO group peptidase (beta-lactamase class C family)